ncbi:MAG TPA: cytochrome c-type biogenesis protein CcmH [Gaiellaceae bacterium]|nr:cytochrome c-type biogenesis protein CcmH [Gaiellaceae bacterium]
MRLRAALALVTALAALVGAAAAGASEQRPTPAELESELVCPVCESTLDTSNAPIAQRMKAVIRQRIAEGRTKSEIKAEFVEQFGTSVLATPPKRGFDLLAWVFPLVGAALAVAVVGTLAWGWSRRRTDGGPDAGAAPRLDPDLERRLDAELARFE